MDILCPNSANSNPLKRCSKCKQFYPSTPEFFPRDKNRPDGLFLQCKLCRSKKKPSDVEPGYRRCTQCKEVFPETDQYFYSKKTVKSGLRAKCKECTNAKTRMHYVENKDQIHEHQRQYYIENRSKRAEYYSRYNRANPEKKREATKRYHHTDRGKMTNRRRGHNRRAIKRNAQGSYTIEELYQQYDRQKGKCYYCHVALGKGRRGWHADHIVPLSRGGSNDISNIVLACAHCNEGKHDRLPHEWPEGGRLL